MIFLFYYLINIPRVVDFSFQMFDLENWEVLGFYKFSYPFLEVGLMFVALMPFFLLIKSKDYLKINKAD